MADARAIDDRPFVRALVTDVRRGILTMALPLTVAGFLLALAIWLGRVAQHLPSVEGLNAAGWFLLSAGGVLAAGFVRRFFEPRQAWVSDTVWLVGSALLLLAERNVLSVTLVSFAAGGLMSDYFRAHGRDSVGSDRA